MAVEENLALFLVIKWEERAIQYANLQALWTDVPLGTFLQGTGRHRYLRLDYDLSALGPLLKEPQPHVHVEADGEPRFPLPVALGDDLVGWFLDFVYRNFFYDVWIVWAEMLWDDWCTERARTNQWVRLKEAFDQGRIRAIEADEELARDLRDLKRCINDARRGLFPLKAEGTRCSLLSSEH